MAPESLVLMINLTIAIIAYFIVHPRTAGADLHKLSMSDLGASMASLVVCGSLFWDSGVEFSVLFTTLNWFWFALLSYFVIELPFALWYLKRYGIRIQG
jgi:hypothetical protein